MRTEYANRLTMFRTVDEFLGDHTVIWSSVTAIGTARTALQGKIAEIEALAAEQESPTTGVTANKADVRDALEEQLFDVSEALAVFAAVTGNEILLADVDFTRSALDQMTDARLVDAAERVQAGGTANLAALAPYGITAGVLTALGTATTAFSTVMEDPRVAIAERAGLTETIPTRIREGRAILRDQLDRLLSKFRKTHPEFYAAYRSARVVVDRTGGGGGGSGGASSGSSASGSSQGGSSSSGSSSSSGPGVPSGSSSSSSSV